MIRRQEFQSIKTHEFVFQDTSGIFPDVDTVMTVATNKGVTQFTHDLKLNTLYAKKAQIDNITIGVKSAEFEDISASIGLFGVTTTSSTATFLGDIVYNNETLAGNVGGTENCMVAVGANTNGASSIRFSINGTQWFNAEGDMFAVEGNGAAWNGSVWVAVGKNAIGDTIDNKTIAYSANGVNWKFAEGGFDAVGYGVAWNGSLWIAVGTDRLTVNDSGNRTILKSTDGIHWTPTHLPYYFKTGAVNIGYGKSVAWNGIVWVVGGYDYVDPTASTNIVTSKNGLDWIPAIPSVNTQLLAPGCNAVAWGENKWIIVGNDSINNPATIKNFPIMYGTDQSDNTVVFTKDTYSTTLNIIGNSIAWNGVMWILATNKGIYYNYSSGNSEWKLIVDSFADEKWNSVSWNGTKWIIVGEKGIMTSYDGFTWSLCKDNLSIKVLGVSARKILPNIGYALPKNIPISRNYFDASGMDIVSIVDSSVLDYSVILLTIRTADSKGTYPQYGAVGEQYNQGRAYVYSKQAGVGFKITSYEYDYSTYDYAIIN